MTFRQRSGARRDHRLIAGRALIVPAAAALLVAISACGASKHDAPATARTTTSAQTRAVTQAPPWRLAAATTGRLPAPLQDAAPAALGRNVVLLAGLSAADTSTSGIIVGSSTGAHTVGSLPSSLHDAAAAAIGPSVYLFGGGNGVSQLDQILRIRGGTATNVGRLPAPSSDQTGTTIGATAYIVGGYTGTRWLDTIVAYDPVRGARVVAHLPTAVRYAAVTSAHGSVVIAGGSLPDGTASAKVYAWKPGSARVRVIGSLPAPTTHAAGATVNGIAYAIGGRSATLNTPTDRIVAIDVTTGSARIAGRLPAAVSDASAAGVPGHILVFGGKEATGTTDAIVTLTPTTKKADRAVVAMMPRTSQQNVYAADGANMLTGAALQARQLVYVPNSLSNTVDVIDPHTFKIVGHFDVGRLPQHVTPAWDLKTLYVLNDQGNSLTAIDPTTGKPGATIPVDDPYNMYFTPNGQYAIVVAERMHRLDFRDPHTFALHRSLTVPCTGVDHMDFSADGRYLIASCEFSGQVLKVDVARERVVGTLTVGGMPQDVKMSPDGSVFYVADMASNGLWEIDGKHFRKIGFLPTGRGAHGLYPSRDARYLYVTNRGAGTISVVSFRTRKVVRTWSIPGGGTPDMGGVSADGKVLWVSGRYSGVVYAISTRNGRLLARIPVGAGPHGLCVWPQPGRYSLGHTGILR